MSSFSPADDVSATQAMLIAVHIVMVTAGTDILYLAMFLVRLAVLCVCVCVCVHGRWRGEGA